MSIILTAPPLSPWVRRNSRGSFVCFAVNGKNTAETVEVPITRTAAASMIAELARALADPDIEWPADLK